MKKKYELQNQRATLLKELGTFVQKGEADPSALTDADQARMTAIRSEVDTIDADIVKWDQIEADKLRIATMEATEAPAVHTRKHIYSLSRAVALATEHRQLDGLEKDVHDEGVREFGEFGLAYMGGLAIPSRIFTEHALRTQRRDIAIGSGTSGVSNLVETRIGTMIEALAPRVKAIMMGADTSLSGLKSYLNLPKETGLPTANWDGEVAAATKTKPTVDKIQIRPTRLSAFSEFSRLSENMASVAMDNWIINHLLNANARKLDESIYNGSGVGNVPLGILNDPDVSVHALGADGDFLSVEDIAAIEALIATENADVLNMGWLTTPGVRGKLRTTRVDAGSGIMIWPWGGNEVGGYKADVTTLIPSNLTKGVGTNLHALIFGDWFQQIIASFAGTELIINPHGNVQGSTDGLDVTGQVRITSHSWWDLKRKQAKGFAVCKDVKIA